MDREIPSERDLNDARSLQRDLAEAFAASRDRSDAESLEEVRRLCQLARITIEDPPCQACLHQIELYAERFFVTDDNVHWGWHTPASYARLRSLLLRLVNAFALRLTYHEISQRSDEVRLLTGHLREYAGAHRPAGRKTAQRRPSGAPAPE